MEEIVEYGFEDIVLPKVEFMAKFDPNTGSIISVGPSVAFENDEYKLPIDDDIAVMIIQGKMSLSSCMVNILENQVEISEVKSLFKIDDVLHRITERRFFNSENIDVLVSYSSDGEFFRFCLAEELGGNYKNPPNPTIKKNKKTIWGGETVMQFYITDYNDPNVLYQKIELKLSDLKNAELIVDQTAEFPKTFSIYTRRLFKNYVLDYEDN
jgi:hypothetical protein